MNGEIYIDISLYKNSNLVSNFFVKGEFILPDSLSRGLHIHHNNDGLHHARRLVAMHTRYLDWCTSVLHICGYEKARIIAEQNR